MAGVHVLPVDRCLQTDVQSEVVHTACQITVGHGPFPQKGGEACSIGPLQGTHQINHLTVQTDQGVVTDLISIPGMGRLEGIDC